MTPSSDDHSTTADREPFAPATPAPAPASANVVPFRSAARAWSAISLQTFGGPAGQIAVMQRALVDDSRWISQRRFLHALNYCMLLPGPEAHQLAIYVGWLLNGLRGGFRRRAVRAAAARACLLTLAGEDDDGGEEDTAEVGAGVLVVPGCDAAPLLEPAEAALDGVALAVALRVERGWSAPARALRFAVFNLVTTFWNGVADTPAA